MPHSVRPAAAGAALGFKWLLAAVVAAATIGGIRHLPRRANEPEPKPAAPIATSPAPHGVAVNSVAPEPPAPVADVPVAPAAPKTEVARPLASHAPAPVVAPPAASSGPSVSSGSLPDATGMDEVGLLERATRALGSDPQGALALTEEHARRFPSGALTQEREFVAIEALEALRRTGEASARIDRFRARFPGSAHLRRLEQLRTAPVPE
jgi:hypothetical protein